MSWASEVQNSVNLALEEIKKNPLEKKLFNLICNDLSGILNRAGFQTYSFDYRGRILEEEFVGFITALLKKLKFEEERWDKRAFRDEVEAFLSAKEDRECEKGKSILGFNDQQVEFLYKVLKIIK